MKNIIVKLLDSHKKNKCLYIIFLIALIGILPIKQATAEPAPVMKKIVLSSPRHVDSYDGKFLNLLYTEAFKRLGFEFVYMFYPAKRGSMMAAIGKSDGELARAFNYNEKLPNLTRIDEPIFTVRISAFTTRPEIKLNGWESLKSTDYKVEYMRGLKICEVKLPEFVKKENLSDIANWSQGLKKIIAKRTDVYIEVERTVLRALKSDEFKDTNIRVAGLLEEIDLYTFLNKKHADLIPKLAAVIKNMRSDGTIKSYIDSVENSIDKPLL